MLLMGLVFGSVVMLAIGLLAWYDARQQVQAYRDGIFAIKKVLDLPLSDWEAHLRKEMSEAEWFGFQRGYTNALLHALVWLSHHDQPPLHTNRLEPMPKEQETQ